MFISEKNSSKTFKSLLIYAGITAFIALFGYVYEMFGHGVISLAMYLAFLYPLSLGCVVYLLLWLLPIKWTPSFVTQNIYNFGVAMLTLGSIYRGVVEIYGTPREEMCRAYLIIGLVFISIAIILLIIGLIKRFLITHKVLKNND